jgi:hypothetical protein
VVVKLGMGARAFNGRALQPVRRGDADHDADWLTCGRAEIDRNLDFVADLPLGFPRRLDFEGAVEDHVPIV